MLHEPICLVGSYPRSGDRQVAPVPRNAEVASNPVAGVRDCEVRVDLARFRDVAPAELRLKGDESSGRVEVPDEERDGDRHHGGYGDYADRCVEPFHGSQGIGPRGGAECVVSADKLHWYPHPPTTGADALPRFIAVVEATSWPPSPMPVSRCLALLGLLTASTAAIVAQPTLVASLALFASLPIFGVLGFVLRRQQSGRSNGRDDATFGARGHAASRTWSREESRR